MCDLHSACFRFESWPSSWPNIKLLELWEESRRKDWHRCIFGKDPNFLPYIRSLERRVACGGPTDTGVCEQDDDAEDDDEEAADENAFPLPQVGGGVGSGSSRLGPDVKQPIVYHELPLQLWQGQLHAQSASMIIDLTPQTGRLASWCATKRIGYVGVCHTEWQRNYIFENAVKEIMDKLADPSSEISVPKFINAVKTPTKKGHRTCQAKGYREGRHEIERGPRGHGGGRQRRRRRRRGA